MSISQRSIRGEQGASAIFLFCLKDSLYLYNMSTPEESQLKAGHPPAVKAGGMRITQHKSPKDESKETKPCKEEEMDPTTSLKVSSSPPKTVTVSGAPVRGNADFPVEAVQAFHDKPRPTHDVHSHHPKPGHIHQPRK
ncbi:hypothetical protein J437_LFUL002146 [Ladona fulva]|uniref:Death-associated protein 1 n=1 Tax=Ladona fulva TaxID=123851 RepID=A0A8K0NWR9_LADFU|nr:hypothetical protein J437_LFUL002146 [Ladona fulva]